MKLISKLERVNARLLELKGFYDSGWLFGGWFEKRHLVGSEYNYNKYDFDREPTTEEKHYDKKLQVLRKYFEKLHTSFHGPESPSYPKFFILDHQRWDVNAPRKWTYVEFKEKVGESRRYRDLIKVFMPVEYNDQPRIAQLICDFLLERGRRFSLRVTHRGRIDNLCMWVKKEEVDPLVEFLQQLKPYIKDQFHFYPEHKGIAVSRELYTSYSQLLVDSLSCYMHGDGPISVKGLAEWLEIDDPCDPLEEDDKLFFDYAILTRSLRCIEHNLSPLDDSPYNVTDFMRREF